jgi:hypothetical protein
MTGSNPQPNSIGGQLSAKSLAVEAFTRRWYHTGRDGEGVEQNVDLVVIAGVGSEAQPAGAEWRRPEPAVDLL